MISTMFRMIRSILRMIIMVRLLTTTMISFMLLTSPMSIYTSMYLTTVFIYRLMIYEDIKVLVSQALGVPDACFPIVYEHVHIHTC